LSSASPKIRATNGWLMSMPWSRSTRIRRDCRDTTPVSTRSSSASIQYFVRSHDAAPYTAPATSRASSSQAIGPTSPRSRSSQVEASTATTSRKLRTSGVSGDSRL